MALAKLWNAVFGKRSAVETDPAVATAVGPAVSLKLDTLKTTTKTAAATKTLAKTAGNSVTAITTPTNDGPVIKLSRKKMKALSAKQSKTVEPVATPEPAPVLRMFRRKNNAWTKLIANKNVGSILDLRVGDGSKALELLEAIVDGNAPAPKYVAIDLFELGNEPLTVRRFHQKIRAAGGNPVAIPMSLVDGLKRLSETIGTVDLVLLDGDQEQWKEPALARLLNRVAPPGTLVLKADSAGRWQVNSSQSRKAA